MALYILTTMEAPQATFMKLVDIRQLFHGGERWKSLLTKVDFLGRSRSFHGSHLASIHGSEVEPTYLEIYYLVTSRLLHCVCGDGDGCGAASSLPSRSGTASGPQASAVGMGGVYGERMGRVPSPTNAGNSEALALAGAGRHDLAPSLAAFPARTSGAAAVSTVTARAGHPTGGGEATAAEFVDSGRAADAVSPTLPTLRYGRLSPRDIPCVPRTAFRS